MRNTLLKILIAAGITLVFTSCQKELDWSLPNSVQADSTMLSKLILLDTTLPAGLDTTEKTIIEYDSHGRAVQVNRYFKDETVPPTNSFAFFDSLAFYYNGNDTLPFKAIKSSKDAISMWKDTAFFFYAAAKVIKDSIRSSYLTLIPPPMTAEELRVNFFTDNGNTTQVTQLFTQTLNPPVWPPPCPGTYIYQKTYVNGNITYQFGDYTSCSGFGTSVSDHFIFDNHPNPGYTFSVPYPIIDEGIYVSDHKNNILETWFYAPGDGFRNTYTYRADGYPLIVRGYDLTDPTYRWKGIYIYK